MEEAILKDAGNLIFEYQKANGRIKMEFLGIMVHPPCARWKKPKKGHLKLSMRICAQCMLHWHRRVLQHHQGAIMTYFSKKVASHFDPFAIKLIAIWEGLDFYMVKNLVISSVESECRNVMLCYQLKRFSTWYSLLVGYYSSLQRRWWLLLQSQRWKQSSSYTCQIVFLFECYFCCVQEIPLCITTFVTDNSIE